MDNLLGQISHKLSISKPKEPSTPGAAAAKQVGPRSAFAWPFAMLGS